MRNESFRRLFFLGCLLAAVTAFAQEGHPLTGTWSGDWGPTPTERHHLTIVMTWDGKAVNGTLNPGPDAAKLGVVFLDVTDWRVRIEADAKDETGKTVHISAEGKIDDLGSPHRKLSGTWMQGTTQGDFRVTRS